MGACDVEPRRACLGQCTNRAGVKLKYVKHDRRDGMLSGNHRVLHAYRMPEPSAETVEVATSVGTEAGELAGEQHLMAAE